VTEERFDPGRTEEASRSPWWGIHVARYLFAAPHLRGRRVLDVACGTGYGLSLLEADGRVVVGLDADFGSAQTARRAAGDTAHPVVVGDGARLPFRDGAFDAVTSFETLEHLDARDAFLDEVRRTLAPGGVCVLSTPNANYTEPVNGRPRNPFHMHEYTPDELHGALAARFASVTLRGQVLGRAFTISPFWDDQQRLPKTLGPQSRLLLWRVMNKLPHALRDTASRALWGHRFVPAEHDYELTDDIDMAPVLIAFCHA
jgi:SAM-dependent methyltransferase